MKIAFIITSVINTINLNLTYGVRSFYSHEQRFQQTKETIQSIRINVPTADIYFIEGSTVNRNIENFFLNVNNLIYINVGHNENITEGIKSRLKGYGESLQIKHILENYNLKQYDFIFKISGRYKLNGGFNLNKLIKSDKVIFCREKNKVSTVLFGFPSFLINTLTNLYTYIAKIYSQYQAKLILGEKIQLHYERVIPYILKDYNVVNSIGVEGMVSSYHVKYSC